MEKPAGWGRASCSEAALFLDKVLRERRDHPVWGVAVLEASLVYQQGGRRYAAGVFVESNAF